MDGDWIREKLCELCGCRGCRSRVVEVLGIRWQSCCQGIRSNVVPWLRNSCGMLDSCIWNVSSVLFGKRDMSGFENR